MDAQWLTFGSNVVALTVSPVPLLVAVGLVLLIRSRLHALLIVINLWLFMEIAATLFQSDYRFASLIFERLIASGFQVAIAWLGVVLWRQWRVGSESVTAH